MCRRQREEEMGGRGVAGKRGDLMGEGETGAGGGRRGGVD